jgi:hypothetical protein
MARTLFLVICCTVLSACVWPHVERYEPVSGLLVRDPKTGEVHRRMLETVLVDAETKQKISDADVILVLSRGPAYLPDTRQGPPKRPKVVVEKFARLATLSYTDHELYVWPFFAVGTLYSSARIFVYKPGYEPVAFRKVPESSEYPKTIELTRCQMTSGRIMRKLNSKRNCLPNDFSAPNHALQRTRPSRYG